MWAIPLLGTLLLNLNVYAQDKVDFNSVLVTTLQKCHWKATNFDPCLKDAINDLRPHYMKGFPEFNIKPFDPFYIEEVSTRRGGQALNFKLTLKQVYERGWTSSRVTGLKTNFAAKTLQYYQHFPEKYLDGAWEMDTNVGIPFTNQGHFNLSLYNYTQVTTIRWKDLGKPFKVRIDALDSGDMKLHLTNLAGGRVLIENILDSVINAAWRPGFNVLKPVINDLVSKAFTKIMNDAFQKFPFDKVITP